MHILYLDDEPKCLSGLRRALGPRGFQVTCCETVDALFAIAPSSDADAILLDHHLGTTDGLTVFTALRAKGVTAPCVLYTGKATEEERIRAHNMEVAEVVLKGTSPAEIAAILFKVARRSAASPPTPSAPQPLTLDPQSGDLRSGAEVCAQLGNQPLALLLLLVVSGPLRRQDLAPKLFKEPYPDEPEACKRMDDRIAQALRRLRAALGILHSLLDCRGGHVGLTAKVRVSKSGTYPAVVPGPKHATPADEAPRRRRKAG